MKKIIITIVMLIPYLVTAQEPKWEKIIGHQNSDDYLNSISEIYDEGIFIGAYAEILESTSWLIKTDNNGDIQYDKQMHHDLYELSMDAIINDSNGNTYIGGTFWPYGEFLPYVIKLDSCGELLWCRHFPLVPNSIGGFVGDILLNQHNEVVILMSYSTGNTGDQIYLSCLDENGNQLWFNSYARKQDYPLLVDPLGYDLLEHNNEYFIAGDCYYPYPGNPNHVYLRPLFIGIDATFQEKFMTPFYALDSVYGWTESMIPLNDSVIMGGGIRIDTNGEEAYALLALIDVNGQDVGHHQISNEQIGPDIVGSWIHEFEKVNDTLLIATAFFGPNSGVNPAGEFIIDAEANLYNFNSRPNTISKPKLVKSNDNNYIIGTTIAQGNQTDILLYKIDQNLDPVAFDTTQHIYDSLCPHTIQSGEMDLTNCLVITSIEDWPTPDEYYESIRWIPVKAYPNPVTEGKLSLEFENTEHHQHMELRCYDDFGRQIHSQKIYKGQQDTDVDVSGWPPGMYIAVVFSNGEARGKAKFVVQN